MYMYMLHINEIHLRDLSHVLSILDVADNCLYLFSLLWKALRQLGCTTFLTATEGCFVSGLIQTVYGNTYHKFSSCFYYYLSFLTVELNYHKILCIIACKTFAINAHTCPCCTIEWEVWWFDGQIWMSESSLASSTFISLLSERWVAARVKGGKREPHFLTWRGSNLPGASHDVRRRDRHL